jgi:integrase
MDKGDNNMAGNSKKRRTKGAGSLIKIGKKYYLQLYVNGKKAKKSLRTENKLEAERKSKELLPDLHSKTRAELVTKVAEINRIAAKDLVKLDKVWEMFYKSPLRRQATSEGTLGNYERNWKQFVDWINTNYPNVTSMSQISLNIASEYANYLWSLKISGCTYNYKIGSLKTITQALKHQAGLDENVWYKIGRKQENKIGKKRLLPHEQEQLFAVFSDPEFVLKDKEQMEVLFYIAIGTGLRLVDCALFKWDFVNFDENMISLIPRKTKGFKKKVTIPILPQLRPYLDKARQEWGEDGYVLPQIAERYLRAIWDVSNDVLAVFSHAKLDTTVDKPEGQQRLKNVNQYGAHSLRHTFISECASKNVPVNVLAEMTGDKIQTLERYYIEINKDAVKNAAKIMTPVPEKPAKELPFPDNVLQAIAVLEGAKRLSTREKQILDILKAK